MNLLDLPIDDLVRRLSWMLVHSLWIGLLIGAALMFILRGLRNHSAATRYAASCLALMLVIVCAIVTLLWTGAAPKTEFHPSSDVPAIADRVPSVDAPSAAAASPFDWIAFARKAAVAVWIAGVAMLSLRHAIGWLGLQRVRRRAEAVGAQWIATLERLRQRIGIRKAVALLGTRHMDVPAVIGFFKPAIMLPLAVMNDLTPSQVEAILAHELAHIRRQDYLVNLIQCAAETLLFYHPVVWWISNRIRVERENCCDDIAVALDADPAGYAAALLTLEALRPRVASNLAPAATGGSLLDRVRRLLPQAKPASRPPRRLYRSLLEPIAVAALLLLPILSCQSNDVTANQAGLANAPTTRPARPPMFDVLGRINAPGEYVVPPGDFRLWDAISLSRGFSDADDSRLVILVAHVNEKDVANLVEIPARNLSDANTTFNLPIRAGDLISVQRMGDAKGSAPPAPSTQPDVIGTGDFLVITVTDLVGPNVKTTKSVRVGESGNISLPLIGLVSAAGLTESQLESVIRQKYRDENFVKQAQVSVSIFAPSGGNPPQPKAASLNGGDVSMRAAEIRKRLRDLQIQETLARQQYGANSTIVKGLEAQKLALLDELNGLMKSQPQAVASGSSGWVPPPPPPPPPPPSGVWGTTSNVDQQGLDAQGRARIAKLKVDQLRRTLDRVKAMVDSGKAGIDYQDRAELDLAVAEEQSRIADQNMLKAQEAERAATQPSVRRSPPPPFALPAPPPSTQPRRISDTGEYYIGGNVDRPGVYSLSGRGIRLTQALVSANMLKGGNERDLEKSVVTLVRRDENGTITILLDNASLKRLFDREIEDPILAPNDTITVKSNGPTTAPATRPEN